MNDMTNTIQTVESPIVYILIGLPGSGKSTWRQKFLSSTDKEFVVLSTDDMIDEYAANKGITYSQAWSEINHKDLNAKFRQTYRESVNKGLNIIVDRTNMSMKSRREFLKVLPANYETHAVVFVVADGELKRRLKDRADTTGKFIPEMVINQMSASYKAPTSEEFGTITRVIQ